MTFVLFYWQDEKTKILMWNRTRAANGFISGISKRVTCGKGPTAETVTTTSRTVSIKRDGTLKNPRRARKILKRDIKRPRIEWCTERAALRCTRGYKQSVLVSQAALFLFDTQSVYLIKKFSRFKIWRKMWSLRNFHDLYTFFSSILWFYYLKYTKTQNLVCREKLKKIL